jgi:hypothetical protein
MQVELNVERRGWGFGVDYSSKQLHFMLWKLFLVFDWSK